MNDRAWLVVVAAGRGERLGHAEAKAFVPLGGWPMIAWSLAAAEASAVVGDAVVVAAPEAWREAEERLPEVARSIVRAATPGGPTRRDSVRLGLDRVRERAGDDPPVLVHDAARPLAPPALFERVAAAAEAGPAVAGRPVPDTIKETDDEGRIRRTLDRARLAAAQTPQGARLSLFLRAHAAGEQPATDDASLLEALGEPIRVIEGPVTNFKITTAEDLALAEAWIAAGGAPWLAPRASGGGRDPIRASEGRGSR